MFIQCWLIPKHIKHCNSPGSNSQFLVCWVTAHTTRLLSEKGAHLLLWPSFKRKQPVASTSSTYPPKTHGSVLIWREVLFLGPSWHKLCFELLRNAAILYILTETWESCQWCLCRSKIRMLISGGAPGGLDVGLDYVPKLARRQELCERALVSISRCRNLQPLPQNLSLFLFVFYMFLKVS